MKRFYFLALIAALFLGLGLLVSCGDDDDDAADDDAADDDAGDDDAADDDAADDDDTTSCETCLIDEVCYDDQETNPANVCEICDVSQSMDSWSDNDGVACDDGDFCSGADECFDGSCSVHAGDPCDTDFQYCLEPEDLCVSTGFNLISNGYFTMGSPVDEPGRDTNETQHTVTLTYDFEMSVYETTQEQYVDVLGWNPSFFGPNGGGDDCGDDCPVEWVSWYDALAYANELSTDAGYDACYLLSNVVCQDDTNVGTNYMTCMNTVQGGIKSASVALHGVTSVYDCEGYRLPTESEWEYTIRAGTTTAFYNGAITNTACSPLDPNLDLIGWYCGNQGVSTEAVGQKADNPWGLYDMSGNVWEWNWDWFGTYPGPVTDPEGPGSGSYRVARGGSWIADARRCRSAVRGYSGPGDRGRDLGFRLARSLP
jgi:formylglycine-generating enzyme required for sulfatase activity